MGKNDNSGCLSPNKIGENIPLISVEERKRFKGITWEGELREQRRNPAKFGCVIKKRRGK